MNFSPQRSQRDLNRPFLMGTLTSFQPWPDVVVHDLLMTEYAFSIRALLIALRTLHQYNRLAGTSFFLIITGFFLTLP
jgi:hypothetical protein